ncbi:hypothetical protein [Candidatus Clostridium radicumherbarum]|uniref:Uncharacterized protein n=1 Tax=Candidatus Clostridium radicumherbarum TaxID=3381662 RepID=A0ABW8TP69_9CLOT
MKEDVIKELETEIDNLKRQVIFHMKRAHEAEMLLREVQPYCIPEDRQKISEFFKG